MGTHHFDQGDDRPMSGRDLACMSACYALVAALAAMALAPEASAAFILRVLTAVFGAGL